MRQTFQLILYVAVATVLTAGCTGKRSQTEGESARQPQPTDTLYTAEKALMVYDYEPERAFPLLFCAKHSSFTNKLCTFAPKYIVYVQQRVK